MQFSRELRDDVLAGEITLSVRLWQRPKVREGGRYPVGLGEIEVDSIELVPFNAITTRDVRRAGEPDRETLRRRAAHAGPIDEDTLVYRIEFHPVGPTAAPTCPPVLERTLQTERLTLRAATVDDADATWEFRRLEPVNRWLGGNPADLDAYRELFSEPARLATTIIVTLGHDAGAPIIGDFMLRRENGWAQRDVADQARDTQAELGWVLDPAHTGHGYATEAVRELLRYCFEELGVRRVTASCFLDNDTSWRLMERVGMRREVHAVRESLHRSGRWLDSVGYAILKDEWAPS